MFRGFGYVDALGSASREQDLEASLLKGRLLNLEDVPIVVNGQDFATGRSLGRRSGSDATILDCFDSWSRVLGLGR